ncbi:hypothetical protein T484DRAFT_3425174 [Baffinella frigidus]|nr:hypothetical protein T484DRAFT_3425174 [Cryptophyta sp. CCMP2293]
MAQVARFAVTFPGPPRKRERFMAELEATLPLLCDFYSSSSFSEAAQGGGDLAGVPEEYLEGVAYASPLAAASEGGSGEAGEGNQSAVSERIDAGSHRVANGIRDGSTWVSGKMVSGTMRFSAWAGPAKKEAELNPTVRRGLGIAEEGTERLLEFTMDFLGGIATVASRGITWGAEKVTATDTYKKWEKTESGPTTKAATTIGISAFSAIFTVGYTPDPKP